MKQAVVMIALIALIGAATGIALADFKDDVTSGSTAYNITVAGEDGVANSTDYLDTIGTIVGVAALITIVVMAFSFATR